tara:strand:- start:333 stop:851 length:519 start_codon:yes stop_codon:yes gene_type:complete
MKKTWRHWVRGKGYYTFRSGKVYKAYYDMDCGGNEGFKPASSFEEYLLEIGYKPFEYNHNNKGWEYEPVKRYSISTMGHLDYTYIKGDRKIVFGLNEIKKPPTLKCPRPSMVDTEYVKEFAEKNNVDNFNWSCVVSDFDDVMIKTLMNFSNKEVYEAIFDKTIILNNDQFNE